MASRFGYLFFKFRFTFSTISKMIKFCNLIKLIHHYFLCKMTLSQAVTNLSVTILAQSRQNQHKPSDQTDRVRFQIKQISGLYRGSETIYKKNT